MQIFINRDCGHPVVLGVDLTEVVSDISAKIERKLTHRLGDHYYTFAGRIMEGGRQLSEYSVNDGATLHLRHRLVGGGKRRRLTQEHISAMQEGRRKARATQEPVPDSCEAPSPAVSSPQFGTSRTRRTHRSVPPPLKTTGSTQEAQRPASVGRSPKIRGTPIPARPLPTRLGGRSARNPRGVPNAALTPDATQGVKTHTATNATEQEGTPLRPRRLFRECQGGSSTSGKAPLAVQLQPPRQGTPSSPAPKPARPSVTPTAHTPPAPASRCRTRTPPRASPTVLSTPVTPAAAHAAIDSNCSPHTPFERVVMQTPRVEFHKATPPGTDVQSGAASLKRTRRQVTYTRIREVRDEKEFRDSGAMAGLMLGPSNNGFRTLWCQYRSKAGWQSCRYVQRLEGGADDECPLTLYEGDVPHEHKEEPGSRKSVLWSDAALNCIKSAVTMRRGPLRARSLMLDQGLTPEQLPSETQIKNKMAEFRRRAADRVKTTQDLRDMLESIVGAGEHSAYVVGSSVELASERWWFVCSSRRLMERAHDSRFTLLQCDCTYRLNYENMPCIVFGTSDTVGGYYPIAFGLCSNEDEGVLFEAMKCLGVKPKYVMCDGATAYTNAIKQMVQSGYWGANLRRLMCWPHKYRASSKKTAGLERAEREKMHYKLKCLNLYCESDAEFNRAWQLFYAECKEAGGAILAHAEYEYKFWVNSGENFWYEGCTPTILHQGGLEGHNDGVKQLIERKKMNLSQLSSALVKHIRDESTRSAELLYAREAHLITQPDILEGYQYFKKYKDGAMLSQKGNIFSLPASAADATDLEERATAYLHAMKEGSTLNFRQWRKAKANVIVTRRKQGVPKGVKEYTCTCAIGAKKKMCPHKVALMIRDGTTKVPAGIKAVDIGQRRKRGRPKGTGVMRN
eukprot:GEMP01006729.1.p1 GENE.GEMP01006729.1~~GEMP01006729.1.p1  ORF type:complete len:907 (-),score=212.83 GEMP01006729.1:898-3618(-)